MLLRVADFLASCIAECATALASLCVLALIFVPLELVFRERPPRKRNQERALDLAFFFWQHVLWSGAVTAALVSAAVFLDPHLAPQRTFLSVVPWWLQAIIAWILGDLLVYWGHRLQHRVGWLWRFHRVHHTASQVDWLAAFREHPLDGLYTRTLVNLPALLMGFSLASIAGLLTFRGLWAVFIHSNVALRVGPLRYVMGAPELHRWHHDIEKNGKCNFANLMPVWDLVFGTYRDPGVAPLAFGVTGHAPVGYLRLLLDPVREQFASLRVPWRRRQVRDQDGAVHHSGGTG